MLKYLEQKFEILSLKLRKDYSFFQQCELNAVHSVLDFYRKLLQYFYFVKIVYKSIQEAILPTSKHQSEVQWVKSEQEAAQLKQQQTQTSPTLAVVPPITVQDKS